jgi:uncharacterized membrane protein
MLSVPIMLFMLVVVLLSVIALLVVMLNVVAASAVALSLTTRQVDKKSWCLKVLKHRS